MVHYKVGFSRKTFIVLNHFLTVLICIVCLLPVVYVLALSLSGKEYIIAGKVTLIPKGWTLNNYRYVMKDAQFYRSFLVSIVRTLLAVAVEMTLTICAAYPLSISRHRFRQRPLYAWFFIVTIIFNGGMIPTYLVVSKTGLLDTLWALVLPNAVPVFNIVLLSNYIKTLPETLSESASLDGAGHLRIMTQIILPLCLPSLATLTLFVMVGAWNEWFSGMLYINRANLLPLQTYLRSLIVEVNLNQMSDLNSMDNLVASVGADTAKIFLAMFPILCVYPFLQKYFVKGLVAGSVKE